QSSDSSPSRQQSTQTSDFATRDEAATVHYGYTSARRYLVYGLAVAVRPLLMTLLAVK
ncbi:Hypothetical predicted protein, partial [Olea europaea subsp. europaea]